MEVTENGDVTIVRPLSRTYTNPLTVGDLRRELTHLVQAGRRNILLNLANVEFVSSMMIGQLIAIKNEIWEQGGKLILSNLHPQVREVFEITKLEGVFDISADEADALARF